MWPLLLACTHHTAPESAATLVPAAPDGCWGAWTLPQHAPVLATGPQPGFRQEPGRLTEPVSGACNRLVPADGGTAPFVLMVWEPAWTGELGCRHGDDEVRLVVARDARAPDDVKVKFYAWDPDDSIPPTSARPCPAP